MALQAAEDIRADPLLYEACKEDTENLCKDVKPGGGRVQACLVGGGPVVTAHVSWWHHLY